MTPKYPLRAKNESGDTIVDIERLVVPDSAITSGSGVIHLDTATGDVTGPASSTDNAIARFDSTTGKIIQNSGVTVDDNANVIGNNLTPGMTTTATAAGTTTLTVASDGVQVFTGVTTQTVVLPVVSTLPQTGFQFYIINDSTGALTVNSSGGNLVRTVAGGSRALVTCILLTGTSAASWSSTLLVNSTAPLSFLEVTGTSQSAAVNRGYITNNASLVTVTLPTTAALGDIVAVQGLGAGGWKIAQNASQEVKWTAGGVDGVNETTAGTGGSLASTDQYDAVELICLATNNTWGVRSAKGNLSLV